MSEDEQQQPQFPSSSVQITQQGMVIHVMLAPGTSISQMVDEASMNQICSNWLKSRREIKRQLEIVRNIENTKAMPKKGGK